jgi:hypothetical protein
MSPPRTLYQSAAWEMSYLRVQVLTGRGILAGKSVEMPPSHWVDLAFKKPCLGTCGSDPDRELLDTVLDLLCFQIEAIKGITERDQRPARNKECERVSRLIFIAGKTTRSLVRALARSTKPLEENESAEESKRRARRWKAQVRSIRQRADAHRRSLEELRQKPLDESLQELMVEYELDAYVISGCRQLGEHAPKWKSLRLLGRAQLCRRPSPGR